MKDFLDIIKRGTIEIISEEELKKKLDTKKKLRIKFGADPTSPDIHLGHTLPLLKLRQFQDNGHDIIFIIGDFTARIGDPSGRSILRKSLSKEEIKKNAETYTKQVFKILDKNKTTVVYNSEWLDKLGTDGLFELASKYTVARMLERDDFHKRFKENISISIVEFLYPLIQGYDSVHLKADVEIGGNDQKFNLIVGREIQKDYNIEPQVIITLPILEGLDGVRKMSKSYDNYIGISESPKEIFGKIMSISDTLMIRYYELLTDENLEDLKKMHPKECKEKLASIIVERFYSKSDAVTAKDEFNKIFQQKDIPTDIEVVKLDKGEYWIQDILTISGLVTGKNEARRMISQGGVKINKEKIEDEKKRIFLDEEIIIQVGKRSFKKIIPV